ncbi:DUF2922 domain-containing protein [Tissierella pigra]|uniref:DUF2922 domain-containing protein n=1 Tax=Tissierella pigra TaxID=2607614 RepID=A0A6N7XHL9_9FIRM|nr:DUF2922 domain-containing protein [Tissierella pigra]MBU5427898.1 DUF2922 domain-containing protein [Tissierella pigra]MSU00222.1 DUF2922 domain-containing protein [Tissierella pigra]
MEKTKLEMEFMDEANKKFVLSIDEPKSDLDSEEVKEAMEAILASNIFVSSNSDIIGLSEARIVYTTITKLDI